MKRLILAGLAALLTFPIIAPAAQATEYTLSAFNLVYMARNGYFLDKGIPSFARLQTAHRRRIISAEDVIQAAVNDNRLSSDALTDSRYIFAVESHLRGLSGPTNNR